MKPLKETISFDEVILIPQRSSVNPQDIDLKTSLSSRIDLKIPILSSPHKEITDFKLAATLAKIGGLGIIPLLSSIEEQAHEVRKVKEVPVTAKDKAAVDSSGRPLVGALIDHNFDFEKRIEALIEVGVDLLVLDTAQAHHDSVFRTIASIKENYDWLPLMVGNVFTKEGAKDLIDLGADILKVGLKKGFLSRNNDLIGVGIPILSALFDVFEIASLYKKPIVVEGNIKFPGEVVKALAAGGSAVILDELLLQVTESSEEPQKIGGKLYKPIGELFMNTKGFEEYYNLTKMAQTQKVNLPVLGPLEVVLSKFLYSVKEGFSYVGSRNIKDLQTKAEFVIIKKEK